ncbi:alpha/beta hydrolase [Dasania marina]|uniref:alpha/beta fold hydrolase n=1 Tax=Dasania marina TaxID=471499 RepID=UPI0030DD961E|tara:strand:+ start:141397 stop:142275 length:879 start_codon:yes stop_codon:yes gene_type:complete
MDSKKIVDGKYTDIYYTVDDGLTLHARDYANPHAIKTILCMHGLTRNAADFETIVDSLQKNYRVITVDQRGRGLSDWETDSQRYSPVYYVRDMWQLLDHLSIDKVALIGTSMGGLMAMLMAAERPERIQGLVINDIGPEVATSGLARIINYVGGRSEAESWSAAAADTRDVNAICFPHYTASQWMTMARRLYRENEQGHPVLAYDPAISSTIQSEESASVPSNLWPLFHSLKAMPMLVLRGELSDLLSESCFEEMKSSMPTMRSVEVLGVGHAPALDEPEAIDAIVKFLFSF